MFIFKDGHDCENVFWWLLVVIDEDEDEDGEDEEEEDGDDGDYEGNHINYGWIIIYAVYKKYL